MNLLPGWRLAVAPRFQLDADWPARLAVGTGVEERDGAHFPRGPWRPPTPAELALLLAHPPAPPPGVLPLLGGEGVPGPEGGCDPDGAVCLFRIPEHLRAAWWDLLDAAAGEGVRIEGFDRFVGRVAEFLAFKRLPAPAAARAEAVVTAAGGRSIRRDETTGRPAGLGPTIPPWTPWPGGVPESRLWGAVNLGDEDTALVLLNLPPATLATELVRRSPDEPPPEAVGNLVARFLRAFPDYPPVRLRLGPGEGCRLPAGGLILDGDPTGKQEPDVMLLISGDGGVQVDEPGR
jgi:hypothetical protein